MERRKRKLHLRLDASGIDDPASLARARGVIQKGRLSHAGLPTQNECAALSTAQCAQQLIEPRTLAGAAPKHRSRDLRDEYESGHSGSSCPMRFFGLAADLDVAHCYSYKPPLRQLKPGLGESGHLPIGGLWFRNDSPLCRNGIS